MRDLLAPMSGGKCSPHVSGLLLILRGVLRTRDRGAPPFRGVLHTCDRGVPTCEWNHPCERIAPCLWRKCSSTRYGRSSASPSRCEERWLSVGCAAPCLPCQTEFFSSLPPSEMNRSCFEDVLLAIDLLLHGNKWVAHLTGPRGHELVDVLNRSSSRWIHREAALAHLSRGLAERLPEVRSDGVGVLEAMQVDAHALLRIASPR
jgi:hypothetical protein